MQAPASHIRGAWVTPWRRRIWLVAASLALAACAAPAPTQLASAAGQPAWSGRLSLWVDSNPPQTLAAGFRLIGTPQSGELTLSSPLGNALARIEWSPTQAALITGDREVRRDSLRALTEAVMGAEVPVAAVFDWLAGVPTVSAGWLVDLNDHASGRLTASREHPAPSARLRLVFEREGAPEGPE